MTDDRRGCLDADELHAWVTGVATDAARARALAHVATCDACREQASALAQAEPTPSAVEDDAPIDVRSRLGRFVVAQVIGRGGMGVVVRAHDDVLGRDVAIKVVRADAAARDRLGERLVREAKALAALRHEHLVTVHEIGTHAGAPFVVMELIQGASLRAFASAPRRTVDEVLDACVRAGRGLAALHAAGFVHRDVKPDNVVVADDGRVVLVDLGLARRGAPTPGADDAPLAPTPLTRAGAIVGTPRYLAPELLAGASADVRADVYALAVTIRECLAACADGAIPPRVRAALVRAQDPDPAHRHASVAALLDELERARRPRVAIAGLVVGAVLVVGIGGALAARREAPSSPVIAAAPSAPAPSALGTPVSAASLAGAADPAPVASLAPSTAIVSSAPPLPFEKLPISEKLAVDEAPAPQGLYEAVDDGRPLAPLSALSAPAPAANALPSGITMKALPEPMTIAFFEHMQWQLATAALADETIRTGDPCRTFGATPVDPRDAVPLDVEWGKVERRERVDVENTPGKKQIDWLYQVKGQRERFVFSGFGDGRYLDVAVGDPVVFCPKHERPGTLPPGFEGRFVFVEGFGGPIAGAPTTSTRKPRPRWLPDGPRLTDGAWPFGEGPVVFRVTTSARDTQESLPASRVSMGTYFFDVVNDAARARLKTTTRKKPILVVAHLSGEQERDGTKLPVLNLDQVVDRLFEAPKPPR